MNVKQLTAKIRSARTVVRKDVRSAKKLLRRAERGSPEAKEAKARISEGTAHMRGLDKQRGLVRKLRKAGDFDRLAEVAKPWRSGKK